MAQLITSGVDSFPAVDGMATKCLCLLWMNGIRSHTDPSLELYLFLGARLSRFKKQASHPWEAVNIDSACCSFKITRALNFIQFAEHLLPWERRSLNFNISSASISGNLTLAFLIFDPPILKSLRFVASAAWKIMSASLIHSDNRPWEMPAKTYCFYC